MTKSQSSISISLDDYPAIQNVEKTEITIGDLHANALKLIHLLVREGIFFITPENYELFKTLYAIPAEVIEAHQLEQLQNIIKGMEVRQTDIFVRFIGDEHSDRGNNDWYIDLILKKMNTSNIHYEIILSNHGLNSIKKFEQFDTNNLFFDPVTESKAYPIERECISIEEQIIAVNQEMQSIIEDYADEHPIQEFHRLSCVRLEAYIEQLENNDLFETFKLRHIEYLNFLKEHKQENDFSLLHKHYIQEKSLYFKFYQAKHNLNLAKIKDIQRNSIANLQILINRGLISIDEVLRNYHEYYLPNLQLLSYRIDPQTKTISIFTHAGCGLNTLVELSELFSLRFEALSYEKIIFSLDELKKHFHQNFVLKKCISHLIGNRITHPVFKFIWNREYQNIERTHIFTDFSIDYIHGHDDRESNRPANVICLDNKLGYIQIENNKPVPKNNGDELILHTRNEYDYETWIKHLQQQVMDDFQQTQRLLNKRKHSELLDAPLNFKTVIDLFHQVIHEDYPLDRFINIYVDTMRTYEIPHQLEKNQLHRQIETLKNLCLMAKPTSSLSFRSVFRPPATSTSLIEKLNKMMVHEAPLSNSKTAI